MPQPRRPRAPGRPAAAERRADPREALLDAAKLAFARAGYAGTSLKQIAQDAHVTPALASYYFGDKPGLLAAVIEQRVAPTAGRVIAPLARSLRRGQPVAAPVPNGGILRDSDRHRSQHGGEPQKSAARGHRARASRR